MLWSRCLIRHSTSGLDPHERVTPCHHIFYSAHVSARRYRRGQIQTHLAYGPPTLVSASTLGLLTCRFSSPVSITIRSCNCVGRCVFGQPWPGGARALRSADAPLPRSPRRSGAPPAMPMDRNGRKRVNMLPSQPVRVHSRSGQSSYLWSRCEAAQRPST